MTARLLDGVALGKTIRAEVAAEAAGLTAQGFRPGLAVILVGDDPASHFYVASKGKACEEAGILSVTHRLPAETSEADLLALVDRVNADPALHGLLVQMPLPKHINSAKVLQRVSPAKDGDGFHPINVGKLTSGDRTGFRPATPYGIQQMLMREGIETKGAHAVMRAPTAQAVRPARRSSSTPRVTTRRPRWPAYGTNPRRHDSLSRASHRQPTSSKTCSKPPSSPPRCSSATTRSSNVNSRTSTAGVSMSSGRSGNRAPSVATSSR